MGGASPNHLDYVSGFNNGLINIVNSVPQAWNFLVDVTESVVGGTVGEDLSRIGSYVSYIWSTGVESIKKDPLGEAVNAVTGLASPQAVEMYTSAVVSAKVVSTSVLRSAPKPSPNPVVAGEVAKTTTGRLQSYVSQAAKEVDALGDAAFTPKQLQAIQRNPNLRAMYRGNRIDVRARQLIKNDPVLSPLKSNYTRGADFVDPATENWWDMTTPGSWPSHVNKYGPGGTLLRTQ